MSDELITLELLTEQLQTLSVKERKLGVRIMPWNVVAIHPQYGPIMFEDGAFDPVEPPEVRLRMDHEDPPTGLGGKYWSQPDGGWMEFGVSKTSRGDDQLTLVDDKVSRGASVGFMERPGMAKRRRIDGQMVTVYPRGSAKLAELSTTWLPTFAEAGVMYSLSKGEGMPETQDPIGVEIDYDRMADAMGSATANAVSTAITAVLAKDREAGTETKVETLLSKFDEMVELQRQNIVVPAGSGKPKPKLTDWVELSLRKLGGETISPMVMKELALDDVIIADNPGLVPETLVPDYADLITQARPFLNSTRQIAAPIGSVMLLPIITQRAVAGSQDYPGEKQEVSTTATQVGTGSFPYETVIGGADISIQMIRRADRAFFSLLTGDLGEAVALDYEAKAIAALLAGYTDSAGNQHLVNQGGAMDPEDPHFGEAWQNSISTFRRAPDRIWLSAAAVAAFIDAKSPITNGPLYSNLAASFTAGGGPGGTLSGLIPVYVPALDTSGVDVIVGPGAGFVWAEDPALTLQADVPSLAGRDIALVGGIFPAPRNAEAFTTYTISGS